LEAEAQRLAGLYVQAAYAHRRLTAAALPALRQFWRQLAEVVERPMSAGVSG
jgi:hypothetical protein